MRQWTKRVVAAVLLGAAGAAGSVVWAQATAHAPASAPAESTMPGAWSVPPDVAAGATATQPAPAATATAPGTTTAGTTTAGTWPTVASASAPGRTTAIPAAGRGATAPAGRAAAGNPATGRSGPANTGAGGSAAAAIAADPFRLKAGLALKAGSAFMTELSVPNRPSKYALAAGFSQGYELWNLKTGAKEKASATRLPLRDVVLSPDGQFIVGRHMGAGPAGMDVYSTRTDKVLATVPAEQQVRVLGFAGNDKVILGGSKPGQPEFQIGIYMAATGKLSGELKLPAGPADGAWALSANGKYLALISNRSLLLIDTATAKPLGTLDVPAPTEPNLHATGAPRVAFSPDGKELALVEELFPQKVRFTIVAVASGTVTASTLNDAPMGMMMARAAGLTWSPSGKRLIYGTTVFDRQTLGPAALGLSADVPFLAQVRWVDDDTVVAFSGGGQVATHEVKLQTKEEAAVARGPIPGATPGGPAGRGRAGGVAPPEAPTAIPTPDFPNAAQLMGALGQPKTFDAAPAWNVAPEDPPAAKPMGANFTLKAFTGLTFFQRQSTRALLLTDRGTHAIVIEHGLTDMGAKPMVTRLERFDLGTGKQTASLDLEGTSHALDVSPSGKTLLVESGEQKDIARLFTYVEGTYKAGGPASLFRPFGTATPTPFNNDPKQIRWGALVDDQHVLLLSNDNTLVSVDVSGDAGARPLWQAKPQVEMRWAPMEAPPVPALSPDRKLAAVCTGQGVALIDPISGATRGLLPAEGGVGGGYRAAFSPDGKRLAAIIAAEQRCYLDVYDLQNAQRLMHVLLPDMRANANLTEPGTNLFFIAPEFVMLQHGDLYSVRRKSRIWHYDWRELTYGSAMPEEAFIYASKADDKAITWEMLPGSDVKAALSKSDDELYAWHPGMTVKLDITVQGSDAYKAKQIEEWTRRLKADGITVDDNSPNVLKANSWLLWGQPTQYRMSGQQVTLNTPAVGHDIALSLQGKEVWKTSRNTPPRADEGLFMLQVSIKPGENAQQAVDRAYPAPTEASQITLPPTYIGRPGQAGETVLR